MGVQREPHAGVTKGTNPRNCSRTNVVMGGGRV